MPQGFVLCALEGAVSEPYSFSNAQKKSVSFGWPGLSTAMFPAQLRGSGKVTFGRGFVTSKSVERCQCETTHAY